MLPFGDAPDTMIAETVASVFGTVVGVAGLVWLLRIARHGHQDREAEDAARAHFDRHGRWPEG
jgi:uncharacterized membrane protein YccC